MRIAELGRIIGRGPCPTATGSVFWDILTTWFRFLSDAKNASYMYVLTVHRNSGHGSKLHVGQPSRSRPGFPDSVAHHMMINRALRVNGAQSSIHVVLAYAVTVWVGQTNDLPVQTARPECGYPMHRWSIPDHFCQPPYRLDILIKNRQSCLSDFSLPPHAQLFPSKYHSNHLSLCSHVVSTL